MNQAQVSAFNRQAESGGTDLELENRMLRIRLETLGFFAAFEKSSTEGENVAGGGYVGKMAEFEFNSTRDTTFSHVNPAFDKALHIFNAEYFGIRAAVGNLPGGKLAVSAENSISATALSQIIERIDLEQYDRFVLHGYSSTMDKVARYIHKAFGKPFYGVWHGNFAQLVYDGERRAFEQWCTLMSDGIVSKGHILKQHASDFLECGYTPLLLNLPPKWDGQRISPAFADCKSITAFLPSWLDVRKNWHANMLAAERSDRIHTLFYYADAKPLFGLGGKAKKLSFDPITHMDIMSSMDVVLNATLIDCHPMVDLEALACHTPAITSRLFLGDLDLHPYARLTNVDNVFDTKEIVNRIDKVAGVGDKELSPMMDDYRNNLIKISLSRYGEFLKV